MRDSHASQQVDSAVASIPYVDKKTLANAYLKHMAEAWMGTVTGAGGAGDDLEGVPFEPAVIVALNPAGATPAVHLSTFGTAADHLTVAAAAAANANPPVLTDNGDGTWDIEIPTQMAPDAEVLTVLVFGFRDLGGSE